MEELALQEGFQKEEYKSDDIIFDSQELIDFVDEEEIYFYGFFDWKVESIEFDDYIRSTLKRNFSQEIKENICDLDELGSIDLVYKLYGEELEKIGITLCCVDTLSDSYSIMLVRNEDFPKFKAYTEKFKEFRGKHYSEAW